MIRICEATGRKVICLILLCLVVFVFVDGIFGATFRVGEAPSAIENRRFAMAGGNEESHASFETEVLRCPNLIQHLWL